MRCWVSSLRHLDFREEGQAGDLNLGLINLIMSIKAMRPEELTRGVKVDRNERRLKNRV